MCGICGYVGRHDPSALDAMLGRLVHRGPDAAGAWHSPDRSVHFGHRRLSILDLDGGAQPMATADGNLVVVFNGEIYNHAELREQLEAKGHRFQTNHSDTEVLLHGYREWGNELPSQLNGMWAFVICDPQNHRLFASRDRFGKKPFYYFHDNANFAFASELTALRQHPACPTGISMRALQKFFGYGYIPAPHSILDGVSKLPAGHNLVFDLRDGSLSVRRYWKYELEPDPPPDSARAIDLLAAELLDLLARATSRRMVADVPVGIFLSGGIDSSTIAALAARTSMSKVHTFTIGFEEPSFDESGYARIAAAHIGADHHCETLSISKARELAPQVLSHLDEPLGDASILPTSLLCGFARKSVTVALGGDGGDELLAGYDPFVALRKAALYQKLVPKPVHHAIRLLAAMFPVSHRNMSMDFKIKRTLRGLDYPPRLWLPVWMAPLAPGDLSELFNQPVDPEDVFSEAIESWDNCKQSDIVARTSQFYVAQYLQDDILTKTDRASMLHSLEVRSPFLDIDVVNFVRKLDSNLKLRGGQGKFLLRKAVQNLIPRELIDRRKKGFGIPVGQWLRDGDLQVPSVAAISPALERARGVLLREHTSGSRDHRLPLMCLLALGYHTAPRSSTQPDACPP